MVSMGDGRHVGRVGALAVALGIGAATVGLPAVAWAEPMGGASTSEASESSKQEAPSKDSDAPAQTRDDDTADADDNSDEAESPADEEPAPSDADPDEPEDEPAPKKRGSSRSNNDDAADTAATVTAGDGGDRSEETDEADEQSADEDLSSDPAPETSQDESPETVPEPGAGSTEIPLDQPEPAADPEPEPSAAPGSILKSLFAPQDSPRSGGPVAPVDSPLMWTMLAFARRQFGQARPEIVGAVGSQADELVDPEASAIPEPEQVTTSEPGIFTGTITGRITGSDPEGGRVTYSGTATTEKGRVTVLPWGSFRYTPTAAARHAAAADGADEETRTDVFTVTLSDAAGNTVAVPVVVDILPRNATPFGARADVGTGSLATGKTVIDVSAYDFDRDTLTFTVPDTDKGTLVDNGDGTFTYTPTAAAREAAGAPGAPASATTDTLTFTVSDGHGGVRTVTVDVAVTPYAEASPSAPGRASGPVVVGSDGTLYQVTYDIDPETMSPTGTRVSILDKDGKVLATTDSIAGSPLEQAPAVVRPDGSLLLTTYRTSTNTTIISIIDGQGGVTRIGTAVGQPTEPVTMAPNGVVFVRTAQFPSGPGTSGLPGDRLVRISAENNVRVYRVGRAGGGLAVAPDGSAYIVGTSLFGTPSVLAVGPTGTSRMVSLPLGSVTPNDVVVGQDGRGYLTVARKTFSTTVTRVYTFTGSSNTVREIPGAPVRAKVVTADGVYQATYDAATGRSYVTRITADALQVSAPIDGALVNAISVTPGGTVYVPVRNSTTQTDSVAVIDPDGSVTTVQIPGAIVFVAPRVSPSSAGYDANPNAGEAGYVAYTSNGTTYLAVLDPDGTVARTVALPDGAVVSTPVGFGPDGAAFQVIEYRDGDGRITSEAVVALAGDAVTAALPGAPLRPNYDALQFGPDGTAYLVTVESGPVLTYHVLGIDESGATVTSLDVSGFLVPRQVDSVFHEEAIVFGADGTGYLTVTGADAGVWALTPGGGAKVLDLDLANGSTVSPVVFGPDGTPYVTVSDFVDGAYVTTVKTFTPPTVL